MSVVEYCQFSGFENSRYNMFDGASMVIVPPPCAYVKSPNALIHGGFSAGSFKDLTRVAALNEDMWTELFLENAKYLSWEIDRIADELKKYSHAIKSGDADTLHKLLEEGTMLKKKSLQEEIREE